MRILQISSAKDFGGGERHLVDLCAGLSVRGHDLFVALRRENRWRDKLSFLPEENVFYLPLLNSFDLPSARRIAKFVKAKNIKIVHAHLARDYPVAALAARFSKARLILTRHLLFPLNFSHKLVLPKHTILIAVAESVRQKLLEQNILPSERIRLIYNGIDANHFARARSTPESENFLRKLNLEANGKIVGIVGEIAAHKGQMIFVRAAQEVLRKCPAAEFLIVGRDNSPQRKYQKRLESFIAELDLQNKIHFSGWLKDVAPALSALDVFVSASAFESFGLTIVEAMAAGCAVVATETDGARETIEADRTGKLVPVDDAARLAEIIVKLLNDKEMRQTLGANAAHIAAEKFGIGRMVEETEKLYGETLAENV